MSTERIINGLMRLEDLQIIIKRELFGLWVVEFYSVIKDLDGNEEVDHLYTFTSSSFADAVNTASIVMDEINEWFERVEEVHYLTSTSKRR